MTWGSKDGKLSDNPVNTRHSIESEERLQRLMARLNLTRYSALRQAVEKGLALMEGEKR